MDNATLRDDNQIEPNEETQLQRFAIRLFAVLLIVIGVGSIYETISCFASDKLYIDFGFIGIFIGRGMLMRKNVWRIWALVVAWLGAASGVLCAILLALGLGPMQFRFGDFTTQIDMFPAFVFLAVTIAFFVWQQFVLSRPAIKKSFTPEGRPNDWWRPIAVAALGFFLILMIVEWGVNKELDSIFYCHIKIETVDAESGEAIAPIVGTSSRDAKQRFPVYSMTISDNGSVIVSGMSDKPFTIRLSSRGYREKQVQIKNADTNFLRVELEKIPPNEKPSGNVD